MDFAAGQLDRATVGLGERDSRFVRRVLANGLAPYQSRLAAIGFDRLDDVLDAGCGFGQWSLALSETARRVEAVDADEGRIRVARLLGADRPNLTYATASVEALPFDDETFDGVFCYSVIYYTDVRRAVHELCRVLRPGGSIYICSNGPGWYLHNLLAAPNAGSDFRPRIYALRTGLGTLLYRLIGRPPAAGSSIATTRRWIARILRTNAVELAGVGPEGTVTIDGRPPPPSFFRGRYYGLEGVSEWLGRRATGPARDPAAGMP